MSVSFEASHLISELQPLALGSGLSAAAQEYRYFYKFTDQLAERTCLGVMRVAGYHIAVQAWWPSKPRASLLLVHGYYDHSGLYRHMVEWALQQGYAVLSCDLPGHGLSSGARASIGDFGEYQAVLEGLLEQAAGLSLPAPWHLFGQSTGAAIVLDYLLNGRPRKEVGESILFSPLVRPRSWRWSALSYTVMRHFVHEIPRRFSQNSHDTAFIDFVHNHDPLQPRSLPTQWVGALKRWIPRIERAPNSNRSPLIVQGDADMTVDWQHNLNVLCDKFSAPPVLQLPGARHHLANELPEYRQHYAAFLSQYLG